MDTSTSSSNAGGRAVAALPLMLAAMLAPAVPADAQPADAAPTYAELIERELIALKLAPTCKESGGAFECRYLGRSSVTERAFDARVTYRQDVRAVQVEIRGYLQAPDSDPTTTVVLQRLMALNWELLATRFVWNADTGEVRLCATLHTDSNFDRRAFRSLVRAIDDLGPRYHRELRNLQRSLKPAAPKSPGSSKP